MRQVEEHIADAVSKGASVLLGGGAHGAGPLFFEPTVLSGCHAEMLCTHEETFGPVAPLYRFETEDDPIRAQDERGAELRSKPLLRTVYGFTVNSTFDPEIFSDGFESNDLSAWSESVN